MINSRLNLNQSFIDHYKVFNYYALKELQMKSLLFLTFQFNQSIYIAFTKFAYVDYAHNILCPYFFSSNTKAMRINYAILDESENLKQCSYLLKCSYLKMGIHGNALAVYFFRLRARLRSRAHEFHYSIEKRCGKLGRYVSFNEIHVLYSV